MVPYMETDKDEGGSCKGFTDLYNICWHRSVKDERDATRTSRMGLQTIRTLADELWMRYGKAMDTMSI